MNFQIKISVITPTLKRPNEVLGLLETLSMQNLLPYELILVDGGSDDVRETEQVVLPIINDYPFIIKYFRYTGGTAIQRNYGIDKATGDFIATIDDDVRLTPDFFKNILNVFSTDTEKKIGGITGYKNNLHFSLAQRKRWRWYKRLGLLSTYEPGKYDFKCGYPINTNMHPPFSGTRKVEFMTSACTMWRKEVIDSGLRFDMFFKDYGILEDAHFALKAGKKWELLQCGDAKCSELSSPGGRENRKKIGFKVVVNYYYVFKSIAGPLSFMQKIRFFRYQVFELIRIVYGIFRYRQKKYWDELVGRLKGIFYCFSGKVKVSNT